jgi:hypothetical protein
MPVRFSRTINIPSARRFGYWFLRLARALRFL